MLRGGWEVAVVSCTTAKRQRDPIHFLLSLYTIQYHNPQHSATVTPNNINQKHTLSRNPPNNDYILTAGSLSLSLCRRSRADAARRPSFNPSSLPLPRPVKACGLVGLRRGSRATHCAWALHWNTQDSRSTLAKAIAVIFVTLLHSEHFRLLKMI